MQYKEIKTNSKHKKIRNNITDIFFLTSILLKNHADGDTWLVTEMNNFAFI